MADDLKQTGARDDQRINVDQDHELSYWSGKLGVSRDRLRAAVAQVGPMAGDVQNHLRDRRMNPRQDDENPPTNAEHQVFEEAQLNARPGPEK